MKKRLKKLKNNNHAATSMVVISYVPGLYPAKGIRPGELFHPETPADTKKYLTKSVKWKDAINNLASGLMWTDQPTGAVIIHDQAAEIAKHLVAWSENHPEDWFTVYIGEKDGRYALALIPNWSMSAGRIKLGAAFCGEALPKGEIQFLAAPLSFISTEKHMFDEMKPRLGPTIEVAMMDMEDVPGQSTKPQGTKIDESTLHQLGTFKVCLDSHPYMDALLAVGPDVGGLFYEHKYRT